MNIGFMSVKDCRICPVKRWLLSNTPSMRRPPQLSLQGIFPELMALIKSCHMNHMEGFLSQMWNKRASHMVLGFA